VGREAMEARLGVLVGSMPELAGKLRGYLTSEERIAELYQGQVKREKDVLEVFTGDEELQEAVAKWVARGKYGKVLELWIKGLTFDWNALYGDVKPRRISLPTYPFARERYWVPGASTGEANHKGAGGVTGADTGQVQHPLLHAMRRIAIGWWRRDCGVA
jgi:acyl transferase domain-containing protein